jgi:hypothetical protein
MTAEIIDLSEAREAAQEHETPESVRAEFSACMRRDTAGPRERHQRLAEAISILTRLWACASDEPPDGGSRIGAAG